MAEGIFYSVVLLFVLIGIVAVLQWIMLRLITPKGKAKIFMVVPVSKDDEDAELLLRSANLRANIMGSNCCGEVLVVDCGMDDTLRSICKSASRDFNNVKVCSCDELVGLINNHGLQKD